MSSVRFAVWSSLGVCALGFAAQASAAAQASNELEEIIVTAERRSTDIQSVAA